MEQKVSVVIPTYNREDTLLRAVDSVLNQTYQNWELFIVEDGSSDNTRQLIQEKYGSNSRINFIERPSSRPKGANACRNIGIEKAQGEYIALLDSDDEWKPKHLETCIKKAEGESEFYGCYSGAEIRRWKLIFKRKSRSIKEGETAIDFLLSGGFSPTPSLFMKQDYALNIKFDESLQRHQDWDFFIRFREKYSWLFNNSLNVIVNWSLDSTSKKIDFESCIKFYKKHQDKIVSKKNKRQYLYSQYKKAVIKNSDEAAKFYKKELRYFDVANRFPINHPFLFKVFERIKSKLQIYKLKKIAKFLIKDNK